jgi:hypothetical protein
MGYNIAIGNAVPWFSKEDEELHARWVVDDGTCKIALDNSPIFPGENDQSNGRSPAYLVWYEFLDKVGLTDVFYDERESSCHGIRIITKDMRDRVKRAFELYKKTKPPGFNPHGATEDSAQFDAVLARLIWLNYWITWAFENCETPAIEHR